MPKPKIETERSFGDPLISARPHNPDLQYIMPSGKTSKLKVKKKKSKRPSTCINSKAVSKGSGSSADIDVNEFDEKMGNQVNRYETTGRHNNRREPNH